MSQTMYYIDGFADYIVTTNATPAVYVVLVSLVVASAIALVVPFACISHRRAELRKPNEQPKVPLATSSNGIPNNHGANSSTTGSCTKDNPHYHSENHHHYHHHRTQQSHNAKLNQAMLQTIDQQSRTTRQHRMEERPAPPNVADFAIFHRELLAAMKVMATERRFGTNLPTGTAQEWNPHHNVRPSSDPPILTRLYNISGGSSSNNNNNSNAERLSAIPSVATTSRLYHRERISPKRPFRTRMPWSHNRPIPRLETIQRSVWLERQSQVVSEEGGSHSHNSRWSRNSWAAGGPPVTNPKSRVTSSAAGSFLEVQSIEGEADFYRQRYIQQRSRNRIRNPSVEGSSSSDVGSIMPPLSPSILAPQDAADANDPGRIPNPVQYKSYVTSSNGDCIVHGEDTSSWLSKVFSHLLDLAEQNYESRRILSLALCPTISAMAEPLFRMVLVAIISNFIDTDSMVAYILVILFIRISTIEISGAIADAESNMLQDALIRGGHLGFYQAGQTMQLAIFFQIAIGLPVLLIWFFVMEDVVRWLVDDDQIARIASSYTGVIIIDYLIRSVSRSFMLPFYLTGQAQFEKNIDLVATVVTIGAIAIVATTFNLSLTAIGWIQVIIGIAKAATKVAYVILKGWLLPYHDGLAKSWACKDTGPVVTFLAQVFPLFLGSLLEVGEWEVLVLFVSRLGGAEVATWAMMGVIWELFAAMTEGLGEAASVRVSFYLTEGLAKEARMLAHKVAFMSLILVLGVTSIFLMAGPNIAVTLSTDHTIQHLFTDLVGATGLANISMTYAQIYWSLAGAQGRFGFASAAILLCRWLVILPVASVCVFGHQFDLISVACTVSLGYAIAACILAYAVFSSDWEHLAFFFCEGVEAVDDVECYNDSGVILNEVDDEDDSESSDDDEELEVLPEKLILDNEKSQIDEVTCQN